MTPPLKDVHQIMSYFEMKYKETYQTSPIINRHTGKWGWDAILRGMPLSSAKELVDYYFKLPPGKHGHAMDWLFYNYDKVLLAQQEEKEDAERRRKQREETRKRVEEWRKKFDKD